MYVEIITSCKDIIYSGSNCFKTIEKTMLISFEKYSRKKN